MAKIRKLSYSVMYPHVLMKRFIVQQNHKRFRLVRLGKHQQNIIKNLKFNIRQWSKNVVCYLKRTLGSLIYVEEEFLDVDKQKQIIANDVSQKLKEQLELLKSGKRLIPLIETNTVSPTSVTINENHRVCTEDSLEELRSVLEKTPIKQIVSTEQKNSNNELLKTTPTKYPLIKEKRYAEEMRKIDENSTSRSIESNENFIDMLMRKMGASSNNFEHKKSPARKLNALSPFSPLNMNSSDKDSMSSGEDFLGFDDQSQKNYQSSGLLSTPIVSEQNSISDNSVFVSESLDKYLRANDLDTLNPNDSSKCKNTRMEEQLKYKSMAGLVTQNCIPPPMDMPVVPETLARLRTVAERRQFLQRSARNHKLAIINNEAAIYRELQRKVRRHHQPLRKHCSAVVSMQAPDAQLPFTRTGWRATSFIATECNKYYYQMLPLNNGEEFIRLAGGRGNNDKFQLPTYVNGNIIAVQTSCCPSNCLDAKLWRQFKSTTYLPAQRTKLNKTPLPAALPACPLSKKPFQKPLDEDIEPFLLAGGKMMVVRMPNVQLEVFPKIGKPLDELAKRYMQFIMPHEEITEEWAKFSVSTLKYPITAITKHEKEKERKKKLSNRCSFKFTIPYNNDQSQILVRRVIDRSEKLDKNFEDIANGLKPFECLKTDFTFRENIDQNDKELVACADIVSELINSVTISCCENSFIKDDPDALITSDKNDNNLKIDNFSNLIESKNSLTTTSSSSSSLVSTSELGTSQKQPDHKSNKKQSRLV